MRALISVSDKTGVVEFARGLRELGWQVIATGGTMKLLAESGVEVIIPFTEEERAAGRERVIELATQLMIRAGIW